MVSNDVIILKILARTVCFSFFIMKGTKIVQKFAHKNSLHNEGFLSNIYKELLQNSNEKFVCDF